MSSNALHERQARAGKYVRIRRIHILEADLEKANTPRSENLQYFRVTVMADVRNLAADFTEHVRHMVADFTGELKRLTENADERVVSTENASLPNLSIAPMPE